MLLGLVPHPNLARLRHSKLECDIQIYLYMQTPERLFKYLPSRFVEQVLRRGNLLFRNLSYFRRIEEDSRGDLLEGLHMDYPDNPIKIETIDGRVKWEGKAAFLNRVKPDKLYVFCLSQELSPALYDEFGVDACIEITDTHEFLRRSERVIATQIRFAESGLLHGPVLYYEPNKPFCGDVTDVRTIPFCKHDNYKHQAEYRLAIATRGGLTLTRQIVNELYSFEEDVAAGTDGRRQLIIGAVHDIARVHHRG